MTTAADKQESLRIISDSLDLESLEILTVEELNALQAAIASAIAAARVETWEKVIKAAHGFLNGSSNGSADYVNGFANGTLNGAAQVQRWLEAAKDTKD